MHFGFSRVHRPFIESEGETRRRVVGRTDRRSQTVASDTAAVLNVDVLRRMRKLAVDVGARALAALEFAANLELQPSRVFAPASGGECRASGGECRASGGECRASGGECRASGGECRASGGECHASGDEGRVWR